MRDDAVIAIAIREAKKKVERDNSRFARDDGELGRTHHLKVKLPIVLIKMILGVGVRVVEECLFFCLFRKRSRAMAGGAEVCTAG